MGKYRISPWGSSISKKIWHGVQIKHEGQWVHCCEGSKPLIYRTKSEAQEKIKEILKEVNHA